jgi:hypothetical protein
MLTLRCTVEMLKRAKIKPIEMPPTSTTILGDWYVKVVYVGRRPMLLAVSGETMLPVVIEAAPIADWLPRFRQGLVAVLGELGVAHQLIDAEIAETLDVTFGKTNNRKVVGILCDFANMLPHYSKDDRNLTAAALWLAQSPCFCSSKDVVFPNRATVARFVGH